MALEPGTRLGSYEILGSLGAGGMGEVYRARDASLKREVAIRLPSAVTISRDGTQIAYGEERDGVWRIVRRPLDSFDGVPVRGTGGGMNP